MKLYTNHHLQEYLRNDWILDEMQLIENKVGSPLVGGVEIRTNSWLKTMDNKRMIYADVYGDLLMAHNNKDSERTKVLDVGGGINSLTKALARNTDYTLLDYMAHGGEDYVIQEAKIYGYNFINGDWHDAVVRDDIFDIVIANDIFPDVDMRLELFLKTFLPKCKELRMVVTWYHNPQFYVTKRVNDTEMLTFLSWDGEITALKLKKYFNQMIDTTKEEIDSVCTFKESIYRNGRQVAYVRFMGNCNK